MTTVSIVARISQPRDCSVIPSDSSMCICPGAVAPPCDPIAGTTNGSAPSSRSALMVPRSISTRPVSPRDPAPTATVMPCLTAEPNVDAAASWAAASISVIGGGDGTSSAYSCNSGIGRSTANGSLTPAESCSHDMPGGYVSEVDEASRLLRSQTDYPAAQDRVFVRRSVSPVEDL